MTDTTPDQAPEPELPAAEGKDENSVSPAKPAARTRREPPLPAEAEAPAAAPAPEVYTASGEERDPVRLSSAVYKSVQRKSLTVHHLQRRLTELGFDEAGADRDGDYGDLTRNSVRLFQAKHKLDGDGLMNEETFTAIFKGDPYVEVDLG